MFSRAVCRYYCLRGKIDNMRKTYLYVVYTGQSKSHYIISTVYSEGHLVTDTFGQRRNWLMRNMTLLWRGGLGRGIATGLFIVVTY